jgi:hypothetical protein
MNIERMEATVREHEMRGEQPCAITRDGTHNWQWREYGLSNANIYECHCGAVEVRK